MKVYIDLGSYKGDSIKRFIEKNGTNWEIHAFEANPNVKMNYPPKTIIHRKAAWIDNGEVKFYTGERNKEVDGASLVKEKKTGHLDVKHPLRVQGVNTGEWIKTSFKMEDTIIVKMNIEGAEYKVLPSMINDGSLEFIDKLYLEAHYDKIGFDKWKNDMLLKKVSELTELHTMKEFYE